MIETSNDVFKHPCLEDTLLAVCSGNLSPEDDAPNVIARLVQAGADVNCRNEEGLSPLHLLCHHRSDDNQQVLLCVRQLLSASNSNSWSAYWSYILCLQTRFFSSVKRPVLRINSMDRRGVNALLLLCRNYSGLDLIDIVRLLIERGIDVGASTQRWNALLLLCRYYPHENLIDLIRLLIDHGIDVSFTNPGGWNALHILCRYYNGSNLIDILQLLIKHGGLDINGRVFRTDATPLILFCQHNQSRNLTKMIRLLIQLGADVNACTKCGRNALMTLCRYNSCNTLIRMAQLLLTNGVDVNSLTEDGNSALLYVCGHYANENLIDLVRLMVVEYCADPCCTSKDGWNATLLLCQHYSGRDLIDLIRLLIERGVDVNYRDDNGWNALLFLCQSWYADESLIDLIRLLVDRGIDLKATTKDGWNALLLLSRCYQHENLVHIIRLLMDGGIDLYCGDKEGWNVMLTLCRYYSGEKLIDILRLLIEEGGMRPADCRTNYGWSPLMALCRYYTRSNLPDVIKLLLEHGEDFNSVAKDGTNALYLLAHNWSCQLHSILEKFPSIQLQPTQEVLMKAAELGCIWTVRRLLNRLDVNIVDRAGKDAFDYLDDWMHNAFSLCQRCQVKRESTVNRQPLRRWTETPNTWDGNEPTFAVLLRYLSSSIGGTSRFSDRCYQEFKTSCRARRVRAIPPAPSFSIPVFRNDYSHFDQDQDIFRVDPTATEITPPDEADWKELVHQWFSKENIRLAKFWRYLERNSHRCQLKSADCAWCRVSEDVDNYLGRLMETIQQLDPLFAVERLFAYGSSAERSNIFLPDEFDKAIVLQHFRHRPNSSDPYRVVFTGQSALLSRNESINSNNLLLHFYHLMDLAIDRVYSVHVFSPVVALKETCVTLNFLHRGLGFASPMRISVDLTITVPTVIKTMDCRTLPNWYRALMSSGEEKEEYLVPYRRINRQQSWRLSYPTMSRDVVLRAGETVCRVYQFLKFLVAIHHANERTVIPRRMSITSYALKTCLFKYTRLHPPPWNECDFVRHAVGILQLFPMNTSRMLSFFIEDIVIFHVTQKSKKTIKDIIAKLEETLEEQE